MAPMANRLKDIAARKRTPTRTPTRRTRRAWLVRSTTNLRSARPSAAKRPTRRPTPEEIKRGNAAQAKREDARAAKFLRSPTGRRAAAAVKARRAKDKQAADRRKEKGLPPLKPRKLGPVRPPKSNKGAPVKTAAKSQAKLFKTRFGKVSDAIGRQLTAAEKRNLNDAGYNPETTTVSVKRGSNGKLTFTVRKKK